MDNRGKLFLLVLAVVVATAVMVVRTNRLPASKTKVSPIYDSAITAAVDLYKRASVSGMDFSRGPCLSNDLMPGWVADIVHSPREPADDLPENQCQAYLEGRAQHFVELDVNGNLVRVR